MAPKSLGTIFCAIAMHKPLEVFIFTRTSVTTWPTKSKSHSYFLIIMSSATTTPSHLIHKPLLQQQFHHTRPHSHIPHHAMIAWFGPVHSFYWEISSFPSCKFCFMMTIIMTWRAEGIDARVRLFPIILSPPFITVYIFASWNASVSSIFGLSWADHSSGLEGDFLPSQLIQK